MESENYVYFFDETFKLLYFDGFCVTQSNYCLYDFLIGLKCISKIYPVLNEQEKCWVRLLISYECLYLARDYSGIIYGYSLYPYKDINEGVWRCEQPHFSFRLDEEYSTSLFGFIKWEDEDCFCIEDIKEFI